MNLTLNKTTKYILDVMYFVTIPNILSVPFLFRWYSKYDEGIAQSFIAMCATIMLCGIFTFFLLRELRKIFQTILKDNCFVLQNVKSLNHMAVFAFLISITLLVNLIIHLTLAAAAAILVFFIAGMFCRVLAEVFSKAIEYKEENDYTI